MRKEKIYYVYILTNKRNTVLYTGVTNSLLRRSFEHKKKINKNSFANKYNISKLVYYEMSNDINDAIQREKELKRWKKQWKIELIEKENKDWKDLFEEMI